MTPIPAPDLLGTLAASVLSPLMRPLQRSTARTGDHLTGVPARARTVYCLADAEGVVLSITPNANLVLGAACERAPELGLTLRELLQPDVPAQLDHWYGSAWQSAAPELLVLPARAPDADTRWLEISAAGRFPAEDSDSLLVEIRVAPAASAQAADVQALASALNATADAIWIMDADGRIDYVNAAFESLTGHAAAEVVGRPISTIAAGPSRTDFLSRMWDTLRARQHFAGELVSRRADGSVITAEIVITLFEHSGAVQYVAVARDITARKRAELELEDLAYYDPLTGLANQRLLRERARQILPLTRRHGSMAALLHIDVNHLRAVNLQYGRLIGDDVLRTVADRLRQGLRESDTLARIGSDEFLVLLSEVADEEAVARVVRRLHDSICRAMRLKEHSINLDCRIGVALYPRDAGTFDELAACAGNALQRAEHAHTAFEFFDAHVSIATQERLSLEDDMHWAWENDQFILHYQPIIGSDGRVVGAEALARGEVVGVEALARWPHLERGMIGPNQFIPLAERTGRILSLDRWAIATAAKQAAAWAAEGWDGWISVNLSTRTLHDPDLPDYMARTLDAQELGRGRLVVEITESTAMRDPAVTARVLQALRDIGVLIAVDDFGVGHSSLAYLKLFPVDLLKLDASFIRDIGSGGRDEELLEIMISLAHRIGAKVVAEGVEEEEQLEWLRQAGCDYIQGYLIGRPAPPVTMPGRQQEA